MAKHAFASTAPFPLTAREVGLCTDRDSAGNNLRPRLLDPHSAAALTCACSATTFPLCRNGSILSPPKPASACSRTCGPRLASPETVVEAESCRDSADFPGDEATVTNRRHYDMLMVL